MKLVAVDDDDILKVKTSRFLSRFPFEIFSEDFALEEDADCFTAGADSTVLLLLLGMAPWAVDGWFFSVIPALPGVLVFAEVLVLPLSDEASSFKRQNKNKFLPKQQPTFFTELGVVNV